MCGVGMSFDDHRSAATFTLAFEHDLVASCLTDSRFLLGLLEDFNVSDLKGENTSSILTTYVKATKRLGVGPAPVALVELLHQQHLEGKFSEEKFANLQDAVYELIEDPIPHDQRKHIRAVLVDKIKEGLNSSALALHAQAHSSNNAKSLDKVEKMMKRARSLGELAGQKPDLVLPDLDDLVDRILADEEQGRLPTGILAVDESLRGLPAGGLGAFVGKTGTGKSLCLAQQLLYNTLRGIPTIYLSYEMTCEEVYRRYLLGLSRIASDVLRMQKDEFKSRLRYVFSHYDLRNALVLPGQSGEDSVECIESYLDASQEKLSTSPVCVLVDDMSHLIPNGGSSRLEWQDLKTIARELKTLSKKRDLFLWSAVQEKGGSGHTGTDVIGGSIGIGQQCDLCIRVTVDDPDSFESSRTLSLIKNRHSGRGSFPGIMSYAEYGHIGPVSRDVALPWW